PATGIVHLARSSAQRLGERSSVEHPTHVPSPSCRPWTTRHLRAFRTVFPPFVGGFVHPPASGTPFARWLRAAGTRAVTDARDRIEVPWRRQGHLTARRPGREKRD